MNDISKLLQEAKPLYFARKKRNNRIKAVVCMLVLTAGINFALPQKAPSSENTERKRCFPCWKIRSFPSSRIR